MNERKQKVYVPKSKAKSQQTTFGDVIKLGFHADSLIAFIKEHQNDRGYINLDVVPRREVDQYGNSHSVQLNDWTPNKDGQQAAAPAKAKPASEPQQDTSEIPF